MQLDSLPSEPPRKPKGVFPKVLALVKLYTQTEKHIHVVNVTESEKKTQDGRGSACSGGRESLKPALGKGD